MRKPKSRSSAELSWMVAAAACLWCAAVWPMLSACGKKGPPVAPHQKPLAAVGDLNAELDQDRVRLTWRHDPGNRGAVSYVVLRAQETLDRTACADCPLRFQKAGSVQVAGSLRRERHNLEFSETLAAGFRYSFSVRAVTGSGAQGPDSNLVVIDLPLAP